MWVGARGRSQLWLAAVRLGLVGRAVQQPEERARAGRPVQLETPQLPLLLMGRETAGCQPQEQEGAWWARLLEAAGVPPQLPVWDGWEGVAAVPPPRLQAAAGRGLGERQGRLQVAPCAPEPGQALQTLLLQVARWAQQMVAQPRAAWPVQQTFPPRGGVPRLLGRLVWLPGQLAAQQAAVLVLGWAGALERGQALAPQPQAQLPQGSGLQLEPQPALPPAPLPAVCRRLHPLAWGGSGAGQT